MRINYYQIRPQIDELLSKYTGLKEDYADHSISVIISGNIPINHTHNYFLVDKEYNIKILIPLNDNNLPRVWDIGNSIDKSYVHRYSDGELCLETDAYVALGFYKGHSLLYL